jgi:general secretion pathway protein J
MRTPRQRGFTLIEVMVSLAIFAALAAAAYTTLNGVVEASRVVTEQMTRLQALQRTVQRMTLDFGQLAPRPVRDELGDGRLPVLRADARSLDLVELSRGGWSNPLVLPRPAIQRVAYRIEEDRLIRRQWPVLDRTLATEPAEATLLEGLQDIRIRYLSGDEWSEQWPPDAAAGTGSLALRPRAVELVLVVEGFGEIRRVIEVIQ